MHDQAEVVEIALLDAGGAVLLNTLVKPVDGIPPAATSVHGLTDDEVASAPTWPAVVDQVARLLAGRLVIAHNAEFDVRILHQTSRRHGLSLPAYRTACTMALLTPLNDHRWPTLDVAIALADATAPAGGRHRAQGDAERCRQILLALAKQAQLGD